MRHRNSQCGVLRARYFFQLIEQTRGIWKEGYMNILVTICSLRCLPSLWNISVKYLLPWWNLQKDQFLKARLFSVQTFLKPTPWNPIKFPPILKQKIYIIRIMCLIILPFLSFFENQNSIWRRKVRRDVLKSLREKTRLESLLERSNPWVQNEAQNIMHHLVLISGSYFHSLHRRVKKRGNFKINKFIQAI